MRLHCLLLVRPKQERSTACFVSAASPTQLELSYHFASASVSSTKTSERAHIPKGTKGQNVEGRLEVARRDFVGSSVKFVGANVSVRSWDSEKDRSWMPVEGFQDRVTTDGSLLGILRRWRACERSVVRVDHVEEMTPNAPDAHNVGC